MILNFDLLLCNFSVFVYSNLSVYECVSLDFLHIECHMQIKFKLLLSIWIPSPHFFIWQIVVVRTSNIMLKSGESRHPCLVYIRRKAFCFGPLSMIFVIGVLAFNQVEEDIF